MWSGCYIQKMSTKMTRYVRSSSQIIFLSESGKCSPVALVVHIMFLSELIWLPRKWFFVGIPKPHKTSTGLPIAGEYMLHDGSDSEDSFTDDGEGEEGERGREAERRERGGGRETEKEGEKSDTILPSGPLSTSSAVGGEGKGGGAEGEGKGGGEKETGVSEEERGNPEMAPVYLKKMLPVFAELFHSSLAPTLRCELHF